jgi:AraC-like DNA-binding protein
MQLSGGLNFRKHAYTLALPAVGIAFLAEIEEHWHRPCNRHAHEETQFIVLLEGAIRVWTDAGPTVFRAGQACAIPPGVVHYVGAGDDDPRTTYIDTRFGRSTGPIEPFLFDGDRVTVHDLGDESVTRYRRDMATAVRSAGGAQPARVLATLWQLLADLSGSAPRDDSPGIDRRLASAERFMKERLAQPISVDDLATISGLSRSQLCRLYARTFKQSPAARLRQLRIEQAEHLLAHSTLSVKEVARVCGFACQNHFSRVYSETTGRTPSAARA